MIFLRLVTEIIIVVVMATVVTSLMYCLRLKHGWAVPVQKKVKMNRLCWWIAPPSRAHATDAGYDLRACMNEDVTIQPGKTEMIHTGWAFEIPDGYFGAIFARSGLATKQGLRPANCVGVCDSGYRGEYIVPLYNDSIVPRTIHPDDKIAQLIIIPYLSVEFDEVNDLSDTERGSGGFGSSGR